MLKTSREKVVKNAEKYVSRGKIQSAIKEYRKLLDEDPDDISTLNRVGDLYARIDRNSEAIELFSQIAERYADDGFLVKAIAIYKKIIKLDPTLLEVYEELADLYHRQGLVNEARTQYQVLADYYVKHDKPASAISVYERMVELEPENPSHHAKLADLYQKEELVEEAMGEFRAIAELMLEHDRVEEAAQVYERGLSVSAEDIGFITDAVLKLKELGRVSAAARLLSLAVERNPQAERVARIAGLEGHGEAEDAPAEAARDDSAEVEEIEEVAPEKSEDGAAAEPPSEAAPEPAPETEAAAEADAETAEEGSPEDELADLELEGFEIDEDASSLVQPPADMLEDRDRRGAAWSREEGDVETRPGEEAAEGTGAGFVSEESKSGAFEFELDLDADGAELLEHAEGEEPDEPAADRASGPVEVEETGADLDHELLERTAAEVEPEPASAPEELFTEAEVLAKYGIEEKALERLADLLQGSPRHLGGYALMVRIHLDAERHRRAASVATRMAEVAQEVQDGEIWATVRERLEASGYRIEGSQVSPPPGVETEPESAVEPEAEVASPAEPEPEVIRLEPGDLPAAEPEARESIEVELDEDRFELPEVPPPDSVAPDEEEPPAPASEEPEPSGEPPPSDAPRPSRPGREDRIEAALAELSAEFTGGKKKRRKRPEPEPSPEKPPVPVEEPSAVEQEPSARQEEPSAVEQEPSAAQAEPSAAQEEPSVPATEPPSSEPVPAAGEPSAPFEHLPEPGEIAASDQAPAAGTADAGTPPVDPLRALGDTLREEIGPGEEADATPDQSGTSWLDEVPEPSAEEDLFAGEEDFFDLGAELEQELTAEGGLQEDEELLISGGEQSLEDIVEGFKRGVAQNLSAEDYDTHFNLGIAYREMGLLDEAIGEFQLAAKHPDYLISCASMLGLCFLEKGHSELAVKWYRRGLEAPELSEEDQLGLLYDLGNAQASSGDEDAAYRTFVDLYGINTNYRDVVARLAELEPRRQES